MAEFIKPIDDFKRYLENYSDYTWIDFGNGLLIVFTEDKVNVRQYYDGECLSSWVDKKEFFSAINQLPAIRNLQITEGELNNE